MLLLVFKVISGLAICSSGYFGGVSFGARWNNPVVYVRDFSAKVAFFTVLVVVISSQASTICGKF
jgi:hypothetical protein